MNSKQPNQPELALIFSQNYLTAWLIQNGFGETGERWRSKEIYDCPSGLARLVTFSPSARKQKSAKNEPKFWFWFYFLFMYVVKS